MAYDVIEYKAFKEAMEVFSKKGLEYFGINKKVKAIGNREPVQLDDKDIHMKYTFLLEDDTYVHFDFQTEDRKTSLKKIRLHERLLSYQTSKNVATYIIYTGNISKVKSDLTDGINDYNETPILMYYKSTNNILSSIKTKLSNGVAISNNDLFDLAFVPIIGKDKDMLSNLEKTILIVKQLNIEEKTSIESILYVLVANVLRGVNLPKCMKVFKMTELGKLLREDGGNEKAIEIAKNLLDVLSIEQIAEKTGLSIDEVIELGVLSPNPRIFEIG